MTKEEGKLLLLDLSARLIYGVQINTPRGIFELDAVSQGVISLKDRDNIFSDLIKHPDGKYWFHIITGDYKPYLRSMSSMTEDEKREYNKLLDDCEEQDLADYNITTLVDSMLFFVIDWLNEHHFDYRGLINLGLALEAPKGMYKI